ncbi:MAG: tRNA adenosine(34) deaminase TadA [Candidatus Omnitrophica bacterium]|nr:tRNA adenosine(34) deaminase TadA [Candidatus Omnitrophota bacterium]
MTKFDEMLMQEAIREAKKAAEAGEVPVGAVVVHENKIIARAYNQVEMLKDPTAHAEMIALTAATSYLSSKWLQECTLYVTIEPCSMCTGAMVLARLGCVCFGAEDPKAGACGSVLNIANHQGLNHRLNIQGNILAAPCASLLSEFFKKKRKNVPRLHRKNV